MGVQRSAPCARSRGEHSQSCATLIPYTEVLELPQLVGPVNNAEFGAVDEEGSQLDGEADVE